MTCIRLCNAVSGSTNKAATTEDHPRLASPDHARNVPDLIRYTDAARSPSCNSVSLTSKLIIHECGRERLSGCPSSCEARESITYEAEAHGILIRDSAMLRSPRSGLVTRLGTTRSFPSPLIAYPRYAPLLFLLHLPVPKAGGAVFVAH